MQGLVYIFIALAALGVAATAYFGLTFSPIEAAIAGLCCAVLAVLAVERRLRLRAEARFERAIEDLSRLLSTDAQAGAVLSQRINALADTNAASRLGAIEADISVLGTVIRQVAEAVAEIEAARHGERAVPAAESEAEAPAADDDDMLPEPLIPADEVRRALDEDRIVGHVEPVIALPQRRPARYDIVPRLVLEDGAFADPADFMPRHGHAELVQRIEALALDAAVGIVRRARTDERPMRVTVPLSRSSLRHADAAAQLLATLDANRAIADGLGFAVGFAEWRAMGSAEKGVLAQFAHRGAALSLAAATSLRIDFGELEATGFTTVRIDATRFLLDPEAFTDFHSEDIAAYAGRFHIDIVATGLVDEQQLLSFLEDGILLVQGPHVSAPGPATDDMLVERLPAPAPQRLAGAR